ncbi:MAG TPA: NAD(P)/FAD-dependent oxidoreductase [Tepidisphaeraceae bacterium]|nr:NAD(P)/FAD-dependent oxidoreductase [Tepidisphaeraceae bacterium]
MGGGPAGACLGVLLAKQGCKTAIFHSDKRPPLIVGESLLPAVIPFLRKLGIEEEVKSFSVYKPGATICLNLKEVITAPFTFAEGKLPDYAYNAPRDLFDQAILNAAERAGAAIFRMTAKLEKGDEPDTVRLSEETLSRTGGFFDKQPDVIVDASGRNRVISKLLDHPVTEGGRNDVALFAHLENATLNDAGHIHLDYLTKGWSWRIPLPGKVSVGVVINPSHLEQYGDGIEKQYDAYIRDEPSLKFYCEGSTRVSPVLKYNNYQLISGRMYGPGWILVGDSAGFVDPVFSPGLYLGLKGAFDACETLSAGSARALEKYQNERQREFKYWQRVVDTWYNGKLFNLYRAGQKYNKNAIGAKMEHRVRKRLARILTGEAASDRLTMWLFDSLISLGVALRDPADLVVV